MDDRVSREMPGLADALDNWVRWARMYGNFRGHCRSIEHMYRPPAVTDAGAATDPVRFIIDVSGAVIIEKNVCQLPKQPRDLIKAHYVRRDKPCLTCRRLGIWYGHNGDQYEREVYRACVMLQNRLAKFSGICYKAFNNSIPSSDVDATLMGVASRQTKPATAR